jgi:succinoglycan biosynthesis protein ExoO
LLCSPVERPMVVAAETIGPTMTRNLSAGPWSVSVVMPAYNVGPVVATAIESVVAQTHGAHEIIVVDDASQDDTGAVVRNLAAANPRIKLISLEENGGVSHARNVAIEQASGEWIAILDADDAWEPQRLETLLKIAEDTGADFVADNLQIYDLAAKSVSRTTFTVPWRTHVLTTRDMFSNHIPGISRRFSHGHLKPILRRSFIESNHITYDESMRFSSDSKIYAEIMLSGAKAVLCGEAMYIYTQPIGDLTGAASPYTRTQYSRFGRVAQSIDELSQKYAAVITPQVAQAMRERRRYLWNVHLGIVAGAKRREGRYLAYALDLLTKPGLVMFLLSALPRKFSAWRLRQIWRRSSAAGGLTIPVEGPPRRRIGR